MIAESVSKAASGEDLAVDDERFGEMIGDINDDEDDEIGGRVQKRVSLPLISSNSQQSPRSFMPISHTHQMTSLIPDT
jgi:hypothetical protein